MSRDEDTALRATGAPRSEPPPTPTLPRKGGGGAAALPETRPWASKEQSVPLPQIERFALKNRAEPTDAERRLWGRLRQIKVAGSHFRRQVIVGRFIADFACRKAKLIVEVDGGQHCENSRDDERTAKLDADGWRVLRSWNDEVLSNIDGVLAAIDAAVLSAVASSSGGASAPSIEARGGQ